MLTTRIIKWVCVLAALAASHNHSKALASNPSPWMRNNMMSPVKQTANVKGGAIFLMPRLSQLWFRPWKSEFFGIIDKQKDLPKALAYAMNEFDRMVQGACTGDSQMHADLKEKCNSEFVQKFREDYAFALRFFCSNDPLKARETPPILPHVFELLPNVGIGKAAEFPAYLIPAGRPAGPTLYAHFGDLNNGESPSAAMQYLMNHSWVQSLMQNDKVQDLLTGNGAKLFENSFLAKLLPGGQD